MCRANLAGQQMRRLKDWRLDYNLKQACSADAAPHCADALEQSSKAKSQVPTALLPHLPGSQHDLRGCTAVDALQRPGCW